jgi:hypothetical protein
MKFNEEASKLIEKAGWKIGRNVKANLKLPYADYPSNVVSFLAEFGNLTIECQKQSYTEVVDELELNPEMIENLLTGDNHYPYYASLLKKKLFPIGFYMPINYFVACDAQERVYMIGDYCYYKGKNLYEGIENILLMNTLKSLQLDEDTGKWWNMNGDEVPLP